MAKTVRISKEKGFTKGFLAQVTNIQNKLLLSFALAKLLIHRGVWDILEREYYPIDGKRFEFRKFFQALRQSENPQEDLNIQIDDYLKFICRSLFINLYEAFKNDNERFEKVKETNWFIFLANLRHSCAHGIDAIWNINDYGGGEICYTRQIDGEKIVIDKAWDKQPMTFEQIGGWATIYDLVDFIKNQVKEYVNLRDIN